MNAAPRLRASCEATVNSNNRIGCKPTVCQSFQDVVHATHVHKRPDECSTLPVGWINLMKRQNRKLTHVHGTFFLNSQKDFNVLMFQAGSLMVFNPHESFHLGLKYNQSSHEVVFSGQLGELLEDLMLLSKRWPMPDAVFWANTFDVPTRMTHRGPTVARGGYHGNTVMPIPRWIGNKLSLDINTTNVKYEWSKKMSGFIGLVTHTHHKCHTILRARHSECVVSFHA
jgi:hypothetical protein